MNFLERQKASSLGIAAGSSANASPACIWKPNAAWWLTAAGRGSDGGSRGQALLHW